MLVIADAGCLIHLHRAGILSLLVDVFGRVTITPTVAREFNLPLPEGFTVLAPTRPLLQHHHLDAGESSAIALALEYPGSLLIIDEQDGREYAHALHIEVMGTLSVLALAKERGLLAHIAPLIAEMRVRGMWLSDALIRQVLRQAGEPTD